MSEYRYVAYAEGVVSGAIQTNRLVRLAAVRFLRDLEEGPGRGLRFDEVAAAHVIDFFRVFLRHWKGEWAGEPVILEPWQEFIVGNLFGWMVEADDTSASERRRFRVGYVEVPRKNGKTLLVAGIGDYLLVADGEPGAEIYTAATKRDQARIAHRDAVMMVKRSPALRKVVTVQRDKLVVDETGSVFLPLGRDADTMDGLNVHGAIVDELHAHKTRDVWDVLETATGARRQPMMLGITTAGYSRQSLCWELHEYTEKVLTGVVQDDSWFGIIYGIDEGDEENWEDERLWYVANPNLGVSKRIDDMRRLAMKAKEQPAALNAFLRLHLNVWTQSETRWMKPEVWRACGEASLGPTGGRRVTDPPGSVADPPGSGGGYGEVRRWLEEVLAGRVCYAGLDLSTTTDITSLYYCFPPREDGERYVLLGRNFIPEMNIRERSRRDRAPYEAWARAGLVIPTPGDWVDYDRVLATLMADGERFRIKEVAFDPWNAAAIVQRMQEEGFEVVEFRQGYRTMSPAMKDFERMVLAREVYHGGDPVLAWAVDNVVAEMDAAGNVKPSKAKSSERIDPFVAALMATARAVLGGGGGGRSVYEERGILVL